MDKGREGKGEGYGGGQGKGKKVREVGVDKGRETNGVG